MCTLVYKYVPCYVYALPRHVMELAQPELASLLDCTSVCTCLVPVRLRSKEHK